METKEAVFYAWIEKQPSSLTVRIDGGEMSHTGAGENDKMSIKTTLKEVRFNKGILRTSDEQTIKVLRKLMKQGETITEDHEVYLSHILSDKEKADRSVKKAEAAGVANTKLVEENERLKKQLAQRGGKLGKADAKAENEAAASAA